jgi:hypothetical protein
MHGGMMINPTISSELARSRSRELDRQVQERNHAKDVKDANR